MIHADAGNYRNVCINDIEGIGMDHMSYLGDTLEEIGAEKAGVLREAQTVVLGPGLPHSVLARAHELRCRAEQVGAAIELTVRGDTWSCAGRFGSFAGVPVGTLAPVNCALGLHAALALLAQQGTPPPGVDETRHALANATLAGRMEAFDRDQRTYLVDVAHNPAGAEFLAAELARRGLSGGLTAIIGSLRDKDSAAVVAALHRAVTRWIGVDTDGPRGLTAQELGERMPEHVDYRSVGDVAAALAEAHSATAAGDVILACGSFALVEAVRDQLVATSSS